MEVGVVAALERELRPALRALGAARTLAPPDPSGSLPRVIYVAPPFRLAASGIGTRRADLGARRLAEGSEGLLSVGFCGGLDDSLRPGDLILGGIRDFEASPGLLELARRTGPHRLGSVATVDHVVVDLEEKRSIARQTGALAVEMEAEAVATVARNRGIPFLSVKVVLDTPVEPLASSYDGFRRVAWDLLRRPWLVGRMIGDGNRARGAARRLGEFFVAFRKELNPSGA
ncbi:MAG TPA: hypothetical protein VEN81_13910 [Planctomycetota bacterium]|jgi:nucleoside phosphorylase|nr:hypothetical protein [Planctomycetota bacterium]